MTGKTDNPYSGNPENLINGEAAEPMLIDLRPGLFAVACRAIIDNFEGQDAHVVLDWLVTGVLSSLGYGEGMDIFIHAVKGVHLECGKIVDGER